MKSGVRQASRCVSAQPQRLLASCCQFCPRSEVGYSCFVVYVKLDLREGMKLDVILLTFWQGFLVLFKLLNINPRLLVSWVTALPIEPTAFNFISFPRRLSSQHPKEEQQPLGGRGAHLPSGGSPGSARTSSGTGRGLQEDTGGRITLHRRGAKPQPCRD